MREPSSNLAPGFVYRTSGGLHAVVFAATALVVAVRELAGSPAARSYRGLRGSQPGVPGVQLAADMLLRR